MKLLPALTATCLSAIAYTSSVLAAENAAEESTDPAVSGMLPAEESKANSTKDPAADAEANLDTSRPSEGREAKNAIYLDLLGPGVFYSINYDRVIVDDFSARIGFSYFSAGASVSDSSGTTTESASFSYWSLPITASYLGIGSDTHMLELGAGGAIVSYSGKGVIESDDGSVADDASATTLALTGLVGYRRQPADGGFVFRVGASPMQVLGAGFLPWGYLSLGAAF